MSTTTAVAASSATIPALFWMAADGVAAVAVKVAAFVSPLWPALAGLAAANPYIAALVFTTVVLVGAALVCWATVATVKAWKRSHDAPAAEELELPALTGEELTIAQEERADALAEAEALEAAAALELAKAQRVDTTEAQKLADRAKDKSREARAIITNRDQAVEKERQAAIQALVEARKSSKSDHEAYHVWSDHEAYHVWTAIDKKITRMEEIRQEAIRFAARNRIKEARAALTSAQIQTWRDLGLSQKALDAAKIAVATVKKYNALIA